MNKGELTKLKIIEQAILLYYENGLDEVSFAQIAAKSNLSQPALYKYFDNKIALLSSCCEFAASKGRDYISTKLKPMDSPIKQIRSYLRANLEWFHLNRPEAYALLSIFYFAHTSEAMDKIRQQIEQAGIDNIAVLIRQSYGAKDFDLESVLTTARLIHSMMVGEIFKMFYHQPPMPAKKRIEVLEEHVMKIIKKI